MNVESNIEHVLAATPHKTPTCLSSRKLYKLDEPDTQDTAGEARTNSSVMYSYGPPLDDRFVVALIANKISGVTGSSTTTLLQHMQYHLQVSTPLII